VIRVADGRSGYGHILEAVRRQGKVRAPRGIKTIDMGHTTIILESPYDALPLGTNRGLHPAIAAVEALQLVAGIALPRLTLSIAPEFARFQTPGQYGFHGAYGARVAGQLYAVHKKLTADRETRQAVITLWNPALDNQEGHLDYPCTVALGFSITPDDTLEMYTTMRSNDAWLGLPYDLFQFTQLQLTLARSLGVDPGAYTHTAWSLHLYGHDLEASHRVTTEPGIHALPSPVGFGLAGQHITATIHRAQLVVAEDVELFEQLRPTQSERWYRAKLASFLG
jgi:thymidylate synthase